MTAEIKTPRTDAAIKESARGWSYQPLVDESRKLERELTAEREKVAELETRIPLEEWSAMLGKVARLEKDAATARSDADMYVRAWQRELGPWMARKHHHIDACVIGTQRLRAELESRGPKTCCELPEYCTNETCVKQQSDRLARCEARAAMKGEGNG